VKGLKELLEIEDPPLPEWVDLPDLSAITTHPFNDLKVDGYSTTRAARSYVDYQIERTKAETVEVVYDDPLGRIGAFCNKKIGDVQTPLLRIVLKPNMFDPPNEFTFCARIESVAWEADGNSLVTVVFNVERRGQFRRASFCLKIKTP